MSEFVQEKVIMCTMCPSAMRVCAGKGYFWHKCDAGMYFRQEIRRFSARNEKRQPIHFWVTPFFFIFAE